MAGAMIMTVRARIVCAVLLASVARPAVAAQPPAPQPDPLSSLYDTIVAQESNFPIPQPEQTIQVATIDMTSLTVAYDIPQYDAQTTHEVLIRFQCVMPPPSGHGRKPPLI